MQDYNSNPSNSRFASLLNRIHSKPKENKRNEVVEDLKEVVSHEILIHLTLSEAATLLSELARDGEVQNYSDDITMGELLGYRQPQVSEGGRKRITGEAMELCRGVVAEYFNTLSGKVGMAHIVKELTGKYPDFTESAVKLCVRELLEGKLIKSEGERRSMVYFKPTKKN